MVWPCWRIGARLHSWSHWCLFLESPGREATLKRCLTHSAIPPATTTQALYVRTLSILEACFLLSAQRCWALRTMLAVCSDSGTCSTTIRHHQRDLRARVCSCD